MKSRGPAVTLLINNRNNGAVYSVDLTLAIRKSDWPTVADEWRRRPRHGILVNFLLLYEKYYTITCMLLKSVFFS